MDKLTKFQRVTQRNTFYFFDKEYQESYEGYINSLTETLIILRNKVEQDGLKRSHFEELLLEKENGLRVLLALTGLADENLKRIITIVRITNDPELSRLFNKHEWHKQEQEYISEWQETRIISLLKTNKAFREGIINLFFEGSSVPFLAQTLPLFELKKLSISKLKFEPTALIDTIIRYKEKGSYSGKKGKNPEIIIESMLNRLNIPFEVGDLPLLKEFKANTKRTMDFIIPNKSNPQIIIESSFLATTSSGQGDKAKTEIEMSKLIHQFYPKSKFVGFIDGIGWYVRKGDLERILHAFEEVFTFHPLELTRFETFLNDHFTS